MRCQAVMMASAHGQRAAILRIRRLPPRLSRARRAGRGSAGSWARPAEARLPTAGAGQRRSSRITTRGKPPETERVSAALVKPASSKSLRVPT